MCMPRFRSVADGRQLLPLNGCLKRSPGERGVAEKRGEEGVPEEGGRKEAEGGERGKRRKKTKFLDRTRLPQEGEGDINQKKKAKHKGNQCWVDGRDILFTCCRQEACEDGEQHRYHLQTGWKAQDCTPLGCTTTLGLKPAAVRHP
jgi:hypothetical protein